TQINDALLTALARAMAAWTGGDRFRIDLEGHGREDLFADLDLSRTVGWFTTLFPFTLHLRRCERGQRAEDGEGTASGAPRSRAELRGPALSGPRGPR